jgi:hypothetical protein
MQQQQQQTSKLSNNDERVIIELASVVDMYGTGSDIIGRRSFGGFRKSSMTTYDTALKRRTDDEYGRTKNTNSLITDEELLERYEKYADNGGPGDRGGGKGGGRNGRGISSSSGKEKRRKRS